MHVSNCRLLIFGKDCVRYNHFEDSVILSFAHCLFEIIDLRTIEPFHFIVLSWKDVGAAGSRE